MASHDTVRYPSQKQDREFAGTVLTQLPMLTADEEQYWIRHKKEVAAILGAFRRSGGDLAEWEQFLDKYFGMKLGLSGLVVPEHIAGFDRIIVVPPGLTLNRAIQVCRSKFPVYTYRDDLDKDVTGNDRAATDSPYAIRIRDRAEADGELKELSA